MSIRRLYVTKKADFAQEAERLCAAFKEELKLPVEKVTIYERYDVEGLAPEDMEKAYQVFSEMPVDTILEELPLKENQFFIGREYVPGQYDQRSDSAIQCLSLFTMKSGYQVRCARFLVIDGNLDEAAKEAIEKYYINPVDSQRATLHMPETLVLPTTAPQDVPLIESFLKLTEVQLESLIKDMALAMTLEDIKTVQNYFQKEQRNPTETELRLLDTYWSDHCRHTTFMTELTDIEIEASDYTAPIEKAFSQYMEGRALVHKEKNKDRTLMDMATLAVKELRKEGKLNNLDISDEINACTIKVPVEVDGKEEEWLLLFKNETHNHPTEIEPFGGAATCLGGCIRDPLSGRAYVYQAMRVTGSADPRQALENTLPGKLPQRIITREAAKGYSSYGNQIGLATGEVKEYYHPGFMAKRMEVGAVIGAVPAKNVRRETPLKGDVIVLLGGDTGRDGCGGATGSSKEHTSESLATCGTEVQKGNALIERKIQRLFRKEEVTRLIKKCNDFGAGGVSVAIGELADSLYIDLDKIPKKYEGLNGTELAISESQERMACVIAKDDVDAFFGHCAEENIKATVVADVTDSGRLIMTWRGKEIVNIERAFLNTNGAKQQSKAFIEKPQGHYFTPRKAIDVKKAWLNLMGDLRVASQQGLSERFDSTIGAGTVLMPFGGTYQKTPVQGMVAKLPVLNGNTSTVSIMTHGYDPDLASWSPYHGAQYAVLTSIAKLVALGGHRQEAYLSLQEYFEKLGTNKASWGKAVAALLGAYDAQKKLSIGAIGGKDSMSGTFHDLKVPPSLISFAVSTSDVSRIVSPEFKEAGHKIILFHTPHHYDDTPNWDVFKDHCERLEEAIAYDVIHSSYALGVGGIAEGLAKMAFGNRIGVKLNSKIIPFLFDMAHGSFLAEVDMEVAAMLQQYDFITIIGETTKEATIQVGAEEISLQSLEIAYEKPLNDIFPLSCESGFGEAVVYIHDNYRKPRQGISIAQPKVLIPVFPGTNCEYDSLRAFEKIGAKGEIFVIRNQTLADLEESARIMEEKMKEAQILMFPGGFSAGDEPDGSGKYMATFYRNPRLTEALHNLLYKQDGLVLGICNGFQALIKLGLLPGGNVKPLTENSPTLTYNTIGRHISRMVRTKVISVRSPWMSLAKAGEIYTIPVSHGEGRFIASPAQVVELNKKGQIATQYVDMDGIATYDARFNPNQSVSAIEGIYSPDGRIFGKMGHSERTGEGLSLNINGLKEMPIFASGVHYFK